MIADIQKEILRLKKEKDFCMTGVKYREVYYGF